MVECYSLRFIEFTLLKMVEGSGLRLKEVTWVKMVDCLICFFSSHQQYFS